MKNLTIVEKKVKTTDCDCLLEGFEKVGMSIDNCFEALIDVKQTKMNVVGSVFGFGVAFTKLTFNLGRCAVKYAPKAVVAVAATKKELIDEGTKTYNKYQLELKKDALDEKINTLRIKGEQ